MELRQRRRLDQLFQDGGRYVPAFAGKGIYGETCSCPGRDRDRPLATQSRRAHG